MLKIIVPGDEFFDEDKREFFTKGDVEITLEHSLISLSKWESKYEKPFLSKTEKTSEEILEYIQMMVVGPEIPPEVFSKLTHKNVEEINQYIDAKMTATWFNEPKNSPKSSEVITSELVYYWMILFQIPFECQYWHMNRLFTLIRICNVKNSKPKKMSKSELAAQMRQLNAQRKQELNTTG